MIAGESGQTAHDGSGARNTVCAPVCQRHALRFVGAAWVARAVVTPLAVLHTPAALASLVDKCRWLRAQPGESLDASPYAAGATVSLFSATAPRNTRITSRTLRTPTNVCSSRTGR